MYSKISHGSEGGKVLVIKLDPLMYSTNSDGSEGHYFIRIQKCKLQYSTFWMVVKGAELLNKINHS